MNLGPPETTSQWLEDTHMVEWGGAGKGDDTHTQVRRALSHSSAVVLNLPKATL